MRLVEHARRHPLEVPSAASGSRTRRSPRAARPTCAAAARRGRTPCPSRSCSCRPSAGARAPRSRRARLSSFSASASELLRARVAGRALAAARGSPRSPRGASSRSVISVIGSARRSVVRASRGLAVGGPLQQADERAVQQRRVGGPQRALGHQQRLPVQRLDGGADQLRVGQRGDPPDQRVEVVEHQPRARARCRAASRGCPPTGRRPAPRPRARACSCRAARSSRYSAGTDTGWKARRTTSQPSGSSRAARGGQEGRQGQLLGRVDRVQVRGDGVGVQLGDDRARAAPTAARSTSSLSYV